MGGTPEELQVMRELGDIDAASGDSDDYLSGSEEEVRDPAKRSGKKEEAFYTEGSEELKQARLTIAKYSLPKAQ